MMINIQVAWVGFLLGCLVGAIPGLFFHNSDWLGGYASWQRRMIRLAHIAFFGIGFLNLSFALTSRARGLDAGWQSTSSRRRGGAGTRPAGGDGAAWKPACRNRGGRPARARTGGSA